jgi:hypothetical protein
VGVKGRSQPSNPCDFGLVLLSSPALGNCLLGTVSEKGELKILRNAGEKANSAANELFFYQKLPINPDLFFHYNSKIISTTFEHCVRMPTHSPTPPHCSLGHTSLK